jgi:hypothetical protein
MKTTPKTAFVKTALFSGLLMAVCPGHRHGRSDRKEGDLAPPSMYFLEPESTLNAVRKSRKSCHRQHLPGRRRYVTHFIFRPLQSLEVPGLAPR